MDDRECRLRGWWGICRGLDERSDSGLHLISLEWEGIVGGVFFNLAGCCWQAKPIGAETFSR